jgi:hypothetical protein
MLIALKKNSPSSKRRKTKSAVVAGRVGCRIARDRMPNQSKPIDPRGRIGDVQWQPTPDGRLSMHAQPLDLDALLAAQ